MSYFTEIPISDVAEALPIPTQEVDPLPSTSQCSSSSPQKKIKKRKPSKRILRKALSPKDRYYLQKLENAKIEAKILRIQLNNLIKSQMT